MMTATRQGVRNLNGPRMDGRENGHKTKCDHHRVPDMATFSVVEERPRTKTVLVAGKEDVVIVKKRIKVMYCANCGEERYTDGDE